MMDFKHTGKYYAIMNVKTKLFMAPKGTQSGGATCQEFEEQPRLFKARHYAVSAAKWWCDGIHSMIRTGGGGYFNEEYEEELACTHVKGRILEDLRVVPVTLIYGFPEAVT